MKVAVVTDDKESISADFGMARHFLVYSIEGGAVKGREARDKAAHGPGMMAHHHGREAGTAENETHNVMLSNIRDCEVVISRGMGRPMYESIKAAGMKAYITKLQSANEAVDALVHGSLDNHLEFLH
ncbi:MAG: hypothetical protein JRM80_12750 [Nitrososphaerota archaeon]|nr:hypothetical protein [Nitrososphaerota archaeon]